MLQVRVHGPGDVRLDDIPAPDPGLQDALVRIAACGVCGTDLISIRMGGLAGPGPEPLCLGHEAAGTVEGPHRGGPHAVEDAVNRADRIVITARR